jgi:tetratricopeptide (TPR) repeat protein
MRKQAIFLLCLVSLLGGCTSLRSTWQNAIKPVISTHDRLANFDYYQDAVKAIDKHLYNVALDLLQAAQMRDPKDVRVLNAYGVVYDKLGKFDISEAYYEKARLLDPNSKEVAVNVSYSRSLRAQYDVQNSQESEFTPSNKSTELAFTTVRNAPAVPMLEEIREADLKRPSGHDVAPFDTASESISGVSDRLRSLHWRAVKVVLSEQPETATIYYSAGFRRSARALARTLPFPVQMKFAPTVRLQLAMGAELLKSNPVVAVGTGFRPHGQYLR